MAAANNAHRSLFGRIFGKVKTAIGPVGETVEGAANLVTLGHALLFFVGKSDMPIFSSAAKERVYTNFATAMSRQSEGHQTEMEAYLFEEGKKPGGQRKQVILRAAFANKLIELGDELGSEFIARFLRADEAGRKVIIDAWDLDKNMVNDLRSLFEERFTTPIKELMDAHQGTPQENELKRRAELIRITNERRAREHQASLVAAGIIPAPPAPNKSLIGWKGCALPIVITLAILGISWAATYL